MFNRNDRPDYSIRVDSVGKCYRIFDNPQDRFKHALLNRLYGIAGRSMSRRLYREHWAIRDISFDAAPGEALGIIGRNGAGKSTLLQIIAGTLAPTEGYVQTSGRITALLELGSGFNPEFTGRENVLLNAQILGLSREEALARYDNIVRFADIGDFIDQPIKTYSSGMMMRLAFAVQTAVDPKILIVDEALSVGDMFFQAKCVARINKLVDSGVSLLFVSHDVSVVRQLCRRAVLLDGGKIISVGTAAFVTDRYVKLQLDDRNQSAKKKWATDPSPPLPKLTAASPATSAGCTGDYERAATINNFDAAFAARFEFGREAFEHRARHNRTGNGDAEFVNVQMLRNSEHATDFDFDDLVLIRLVVQCYKNLSNLNVAIRIRTIHGTDIAFFDTRLQNEMSRQYSASNVYVFDWKIKLPLLHGKYIIGCGLAHPPSGDGQDWEYVDVVPIAYEFTVAPRRKGMIDAYVALPANLSISCIGRETGPFQEPVQP